MMFLSDCNCATNTGGGKALQKKVRLHSLRIIPVDFTLRRFASANQHRRAAPKRFGFGPFKPAHIPESGQHRREVYVWRYIVGPAWHRIDGHKQNGSKSQGSGPREYDVPPNGEILEYVVGAPASGIGSEQSWPSRIGLGHPPLAESNPLRLRMSFM